MAADAPHTGMGAKLQRYNGSIYVDVLGLKSLGGPSMSRDTHDTTDMASTIPYRTFVGGITDAGEISLSGNLLPGHASQNQTDAGLLAEFDLDSCDSVTQWKIVFPECEGDPEAEMTFDGVLSGFGMDIPFDDLMTVSGSIKVSGRPVLTISA